MRNYRNKLDRVKKQFLQKCQETTCHYCGVLITKENRSIDHKQAMSKGGDKYDDRNFLLSCAPCNNAKSNYDYDYFKENWEKIVSGKLTPKFDYDQLSAKDKKFFDINHGKELSVCFEQGKFEPIEQLEIKRHRSPTVSLIKLTPTKITLNYPETLPEGLESVIKEKVFMVIGKMGIPVKKFHAYVNKDATEIIFEISEHFRVMLNTETFEERSVSIRELAAFKRS